MAAALPLPTNSDALLGNMPADLERGHPIAIDGDLLETGRPMMVVAAPGYDAETGEVRGYYMPTMSDIRMAAYDRRRGFVVTP